MERGKRSQGNAQHQGQRHGHDAELQRDGKALADQFGDRKILVFERRPEIAVQQRLEVASILRPDRLIQAVGALADSP